MLSFPRTVWVRQQTPTLVKLTLQPIVVGLRRRATDSTQKGGRPEIKQFVEGEGDLMGTIRVTAAARLPAPSGRFEPVMTQ